MAKMPSWSDVGREEGFADKVFRPPSDPMSCRDAYRYGYEQGQADAGRAGRYNYGDK